MQLSFEEYHYMREQQRTEDEKNKYSLMLDMETLEARACEKNAEKYEDFKKRMAAVSEAERRENDRLAYIIEQMNERQREEKNAEMTASIENEKAKAESEIKAQYAEKYGINENNEPTDTALKKLLEKIIGKIE